MVITAIAAVPVVERSMFPLIITIVIPAAKIPMIDALRNIVEKFVSSKNVGFNIENTTTSIR